jgi:tetratricopeptide (TPR) repeat protein
MADLNDGLKRQPNNAPALYERGLLRNGRNDITGALSDFDAAIKLDPNNAAFLKSRAMARASTKGKDASQEIAALDELISLDPNSAKNYYRRGLAHMRNHDADQARADFKTALAKDRRMKEARIALDRLTKESKHWKTKPVEVAEKPAPPIEAKSATKPSAEPKAETKASESAKTASAEAGPPDTAASDRQPAQTPAATSAVKKDVELPPAKPASEPTAARQQDTVKHAVREQRATANTPTGHRHAERRHAETRRPQARYFYYRDGRQVSFSEAFR